jgi:hypothetical protein
LEHAVAVLSADPVLLATIRGRLSSLLRFMRALTELICYGGGPRWGDHHGHHDRLEARATLLLREPGAPLDNNVCERAIKKAILHRKNALFYRTRNGARG